MTGEYISANPAASVAINSNITGTLVLEYVDVGVQVNTPETAIQRFSMIKLFHMILKQQFCINRNVKDLKECDCKEEGLAYQDLKVISQAFAFPFFNPSP